MSSVSHPAMSLFSSPGDDSVGLSRELRTLADVCRFRAAAAPYDLAYTFLVDGEAAELNFTFQQLDLRARAIAAHLQRRGAVGERVLLVFDPGLDYVAAILGCFYAGAVAVPVYPPDPFRLARTLPRLRAVVKNAEARFLFSAHSILEASGGKLQQICGERTITVEQIADDEAADWRRSESDSEDLALLQYTSGSTGEPRGVALSHANVMHNLAVGYQLMDVPDAVGVHWLPPYHDMGLIGGIMLPLYGGRRTVLMSPLAFMQRPFRWLQAIHRYRGTTTGGPNFAYELCVRKISAEECEGLDLSSWQVAVNGAEPVRADTMARFVEKFAPYGFRPQTPMPAYGMAETTLIISAVPIAQKPTVRAFDGKALEANFVRLTTSDDPSARRLVGCGRPALEDVRIVDPDSRRQLPAGRVGEIWIRSPSVAQGYWNRPEETAQVFGASILGGGGGYLRTGDLGFLHDGELYVAGRLKELIILGGRNFYPHDLERAAQEAHPALKQDGGASFSIEVEDEERLVLVQEVVRPRRYDLDEVIRAIRSALAEQFDLAAHAIVLIPAGSLPKTSSGKTRRRQCREDYFAGRLNVLRAWRIDEAGDSVALAEQHDSPSTETERRLAGLWRELLGIESIGRQSDFFALGAQSLRVAQLVSRMAAEFGVEVPLAELFEDPTLAGVAAAVDRASSLAPTNGAGSLASALLSIPRTESSGPHPLSPSQQRLWFLEQVGEGSQAAHVPLFLDLSGPVDAAALEAALADAGERHDMLRARFLLQDGAPVQEIAPDARLALENFDLSHSDAKEEEQQLQQWQTEWLARPFDPSQAPLARAALVTLASERRVLAIALHHIICDGWSLEVLLRDLTIAYHARRSGHAPAWGAAPVRFVDYARWRQEQLTNEKGQDDLAWWRRRLEGAPQSLDLPTDRPRSAKAGTQPASVVRRLPKSLNAALNRLARDHGATPFMVHLAVFQTLLSRYAGREDLLVGTAVAGRTRPDLEETIGCFINTVPLRADLSGDPTFAELLQRTRASVLDDLQRGETPFEKVVEAVQPQRRAGATPLVQALFLYQTPLRSAGRLGEAEVTAAGSDYSGLTVFDLSLVVEPHGDEVEAALVFDERLFDRATIAAMLDSYTAALEQIAAHPAARLSELPIPSSQERRILLHQWNATEAELPSVAGFHELFEAQAEKTPDAMAIEFGDLSWTYRELNDRANAVAEALRNLGVAPDTPVGVHLSRRPELVATVLGVAKAGAAYVPLDPEYPPSRLALMIADCGMSVLITEAALAKRLPDTDAQIVTIEDILSGRTDIHVRHSLTARHLHACDDGHECPSYDDRLAYIIYTSGSTGTPKGVMVPQRAVVNFLLSMAREPGLAAGDAMLAATTVSFDIAVLELFLPLTVGAKICLADRETATDGRALADFLRRRGVNVMQGTPAAYRMLLAAGWRPAPGMKLLVGGEAVSADLAWSLLGENVELWNMYGPTETTVWSAVHRITQAVDPIPIGRPIANTQLYVLDGHGRPAPRGAVGELCIGGAGVARGYWGRPELTQERFLPSPFRDGATLYKTGDLVRWRSDGVLEFLGRADSQVKVRGFRIELGEIEAALDRHPAVRESAVIAPADESGERRLVAYYSPASGASPTTEELRRRLSESLPPYMVPTAFVALPQLPHTPAGKIDRKALPTPEGESFAAAAHYVAPRTPLEEEIAAAWREVLGLERVGVEDNFFELGGHSLLAAQLFSRLREGLRVEIPLREFYRRPTVAALADAVVRAGAQQDEGRPMQDLLDRLDAMTDEEAAAFLRDTEDAS